MTAEIFDPATDTFTPTGNMAAGRAYHAAALLHDGRVAVFGGTDPERPSPSYELFDPASGTFTAGPVPMLGIPRGFESRGFQSAVLNDGRVVMRGPAFLGGCQESEGCFFPVFVPLTLFDPLALSYSEVPGNRGTPCQYRTMSLLDDGRLLLAGGLLYGALDSPISVDTADLVDPDGALATRTVNIPARYSHAAVRLDDGRVLVSGGVLAAPNTQAITLADALLFDPVANVFRPAGSMLTARREHAMTLLASGAVLVTAGLDANNQPLNTAELFNPASRTFESAGSMVVTRTGRIYRLPTATVVTGYTATALNDGRALIAGGVVVVDGTPTATAELFQ